MKIKKSLLLILFLISLSYTFMLNELNVYFIRKQNPVNSGSNTSLVYNSTIYSIDNYWYLNQVPNFITYKKFTFDTSQTLYGVRRTPVYPLFYGLHYIVFGKEKSFYYIRFSQAIILALAVVFLFLAVYNFTANVQLSLIAAFLYGLQPSVVIGAYFTTTEALSSELVCFLFYALSLCKLNPAKKNWLLAGFIFALASLCRPSVVFIIASCFFAICSFNHQNFKRIIYSGIFFLFGASILFVPWILRNYHVTRGDVVVLEKAYGDPMDYGMPNIYLRDWIGCWGNPADFSSERISNLMRSNLYNKEMVAKDHLIDSMVASIPARAYKGNNRLAIKSAYANLYEFYRRKNLFCKTMSYDSIERIASQSLLHLKYNFVRLSPLQYYVITPLLIGKSVIFQSNSTSITFLDDYHGDYLKMSIKGILYMINLFSFLSIFFIPFYYKKYKSIYLICTIAVICTFLIIIYNFRYYENRYNFPIYPFMYTLLAISIYEMCVFAKKRLHL